MADDLNVLAAFLAVAEDKSFTRAARRLGVSPSALSHSIRGLEERLGVRLLSRTTRSVAPTEAGEQLMNRLQPAFKDVRDAVDQLLGLRDRPAGRVRLVVSPMAAALVLAPAIGSFATAYPDVVLDVTTAADHVDLVAGGFDAGIQLGEYVELTWLPFAFRPTIARRSLARRPTSKRDPGRPPPATCPIIAASISDAASRASTVGSSRRMGRRCQWP